MLTPIFAVSTNSYVSITLVTEVQRPKANSHVRFEQQKSIHQEKKGQGFFLGGGGSLCRNIMRSCMACTTMDIQEQRPTKRASKVVPLHPFINTICMKDMATLRGLAHQVFILKLNQTDRACLIVTNHVAAFVALQISESSHQEVD